MLFKSIRVLYGVVVVKNKTSLHGAYKSNRLLQVYPHLGYPKKTFDIIIL